MNRPIPFLLTTACSAAIAWAVVAFREPPTSSRGAGPPPVAAPSALAALDARVEALSAEVRGLALRPPAAAPAESRVPVAAPSAPEEVEAIVRRMVRDESLVEPLPAEVLAWPGGALDARGAFRAIRALGIESEEARALWAEAAENGQLHAILAAMEEELATRPETPDKHFDRARAYYSAARALPSNIDGNWWVDSNDAYDRALELDPFHWQARYDKARNMSFWPVAYGGQAEAIRHFEVLLEQQEQRTPEPRYAQSYLWLGNLYDQQGKGDLARATWERGLALYPDDEGLARKLASFDRASGGGR